MAESSEGALSSIAEKIGLKFDSSNKQKVAYVASAIFLNGFSNIIVSGTIDFASIVGSAFSGLSGFTLAQIQQMTENIHQNLTELMKADMKTAFDHFKRKEYQMAKDFAISGFRKAPKKKKGIPTKLACTRLKIMTELILLAKDDDDEFFKSAAEKVQRNLDELLDEPEVEKLWKKGILPIDGIKSPKNPFSSGKDKKLIDEVSFILNIFYGSMSESFGWTHPDRKVENGDLGVIYTKYLPTGKENELIVPISKFETSMTSMKIYKENDQLEISIIFIENNTPRESKLNPVSISLKPSRSSIWILVFQNGTFSLKMFDSSKEENSLSTVGMPKIDGEVGKSTRGQTGYFPAKEHFEQNEEMEKCKPNEEHYCFPRLEIQPSSQPATSLQTEQKTDDGVNHPLVSPRISHAGKNYLGIAVCFDAYEGNLKLETAAIKEEMMDIVKILKTEFHYKFPYEYSMPEGLNTFVNPKDLMRSLKIFLEKKYILQSTDVCLLYFHGHGKFVAGQLCIIGKDNIIPVNEIMNEVHAKTRAGKFYIIFDCCSDLPEDEVDKDTRERVEKVQNTRKDVTFSDRVVVITVAPDGHTAPATNGKTLSSVLCRVLQENKGKGFLLDDLNQKLSEEYQKTNVESHFTIRRQINAVFPY